ncbi:hypothetical protein [Polyangium aurulentum]|uniref:hypothetical protein n=1 Tax=Polyangium aurulentum TaxID=2567896 RepID=UPI0010AE0D59|nr:hypothetical protein [Polyangium aurulentum]UQA55438.1 hypothetical protein E8A73_029320 [Polyangium aurulentum]
MSSTSLTIERYAEMRAEMEVGRLRDEVLARADLTLDAWTAMQRQWLERMGAELERGRFELTNRYTQAFLERQRALQERSQPPPAAGEIATPVEAPAFPAPSRAPALPSMPEPPRVAAPERAAASPPAVVRPGALHGESEDNTVKTIPPAAAPSNPALPFADRSQIAWLADLPEDTPLETTLPAIPRGAPPKVLPFQERAAAAGTAMSAGRNVRPAEGTTTPTQPSAPPRMANALPFRAEDADASTDDDVEELASRTLAPGALASRPALPFQQVQDEGEDNPLARTMFGDAAIPLRQDAARGVREDLAVTIPLTPEVVPRGPALPFQTKQALDDDDDAGDANTTQLFAAAKSPARVPEVENDDASNIPTLPQPPGIQELSLEAHASLCAKLALSPADAEQIFARYGLASPEKRRVVDAAWKERLRREPKLYEEWQRLYSMFYARWSQQGPR